MRTTAHSVPVEEGFPLVSLFGAPLDTGNLGVSALGESIIQSVGALRPMTDLLVFDNARGRRHMKHPDVGDYFADGAWISRRLHRQESLWSMRANSLVRFPPNRNVDTVRRSTVVLDITGGDSFTDLYGPRRWRLSVLPKLIALRVGTPLVLLPQTYGPFANAKRREQAVDLIAHARQAWARDPNGMDQLRELLGDRFDPSRHRQGVDVAFALPARRPEALPAPLDDWFSDTTDETVVGLNVSGLLMNDAQPSSAQFGLQLDYRRTMTELARRLLTEIADRLVLVPHVRGPGGESDDEACRRLAATLADPDRVQVLPPGLDAGTTKWCISRLDWFCGTRMHSTIAALSSGVPAAAVAYSHKTRGVFETCGLGHAVADARRLDEAEVLEHLIARAHARESDRQVLSARVDEIVGRASAQFHEILDGALDAERQG